MATFSDIRVKGLGRRKLGELALKARQQGMTPGRYVRQLVEEDLAITRAAREKTFEQILGPGRVVDEESLDRLVDQLRTEHHRNVAQKELNMVRPAPFRVVLDTNIMVRAIVNIGSASGQILAACQRRDFVPLLSKRVQREYRATVLHPKLLSTYPSLDPENIRTALERLAYVAETISTTKRFEFRRDPRDAKFIELAISGQATQLITMDADLLDLTSGHDSAARRFRQLLPTTRILRPDEFLRQFGELLKE